MENQNEQKLKVMSEDEFNEILKNERSEAVNKAIEIALTPILRFAKLLSTNKTLESESSNGEAVEPYEIADILRLMVLGASVEIGLQSDPRMVSHSYISLEDFKDYAAGEPL